MAGGIGSPVSKEVVSQIEARKKVIGKKESKTTNDLLYTTSRTGWVRLSSSVNTITDEEAARLEKHEGRRSIKGSNKLAGYNILEGGLLNPNRTLRKGVNTYGQGNDDDIEDKNAYQNRINSSGFRPMPGITGMAVKSKNTFGTLREAEVQFTVWTLEDFENMERIYLRPGFTMMLEWGHSLYVKDDGALITDIQTVGNKYFADGVTAKQILEEIAEIRRSSDYNYEGLLGYVKNFSWSYNANGGYDCSVSIISQGEILESLKLAFDPAQRIDPAELTSTTTTKGKEQRKSMYHYFIQTVQEFTTPTYNKATLAGVAPTLASKLEDFTGYYQDVQLDDTWVFDTDTPMHWVTLRTIFDIFNKFIATVDTTKPIADPNRQYITINTDYDQSSDLLTCSEHFSIDPTVCVLMGATKVQATTTAGSVVSAVANAVNQVVGAVGNVLNIGTSPVVGTNASTTMTSTEDLKVNNIHDNLVVPANSRKEDVLNILVSLPFLKLKLDEMINPDGKSDKSAYDLFRALFDGIESALGGVNDLDLAFDDDLGKFFLIDRNSTPPATEVYPELKLTGLDSIFTEVSMQSKITNNIGSQISVAAQGSTLNYSDNVENILKWNPNVLDRMRPVKDTTTRPVEGDAEAEAERKEREQDWMNDVVEFYTSFNSSDGYDKDDLDAAKTLHAEWTVHKVNSAKRDRREPIPGLVPVELSFKLDGIGGFKIGEAFRIAAGILPSKYQGKFGYIITGLEHSLDSKNRWETSITTQFYLIESTTPTAGGTAQTSTGANPFSTTPTLPAGSFNQQLFGTGPTSFSGMSASTKGNNKQPLPPNTYTLPSDTDFYSDVLRGIGAPVTPQNLQFMTAWRQTEYGLNYPKPGAIFNPFNTTLNKAGATKYKDSTKGVKNYKTYQDGVKATVDTLHSINKTRYKQILDAFKNNAGMDALARAVVDSPWGTESLLYTMVSSYKNGAKPKPKPILRAK